MPYSPSKKKIAVIGSGIGGLSAAWMLDRAHDVTIYEKNDYIGGHTNTVDVGLEESGVDTGFIVYNALNYPNLVALLDYLKVATKSTDMSFSVSADDGGFEYGGGSMATMLAQPSNALRPRFWSMVRDILRFYKSVGGVEAQLVAGDSGGSLSLGAFLAAEGYSRAFIEDHILPMGAAIWSTPMDRMLDYPLDSFLRFLRNHGLTSLTNRPQWRTVSGGSRSYVEAMLKDFRGEVRRHTQVVSVTRTANGVMVEDRQRGVDRFDEVVFASHADQTLRMLRDASGEEEEILGAFEYQNNLAVLHSDKRLMPKRRAAWSSWNYLRRRGEGADARVFVTYWMNRLQRLGNDAPDYFVSLNPPSPPEDGSIHRSFMYEHPVFTLETDRMQSRIWDIQGQGGVWFCGSYLGSGFHEDALQAGLAVAEAIGPDLRPWTVDEPSGRLSIPAFWAPQPQRVAA